MNITGIIVTRGDVDLEPCFETWPEEWERVVWNNQDTTLYGDLSVYGRYAAIEYASHDLIYVQDDDVIVSDPQAIVDTFLATREGMSYEITPSGHAVWAGPPGDGGKRRCVQDEIVANMPPEFRHDGYTDSCLVGFGACFHRDAPTRAFKRFLPSLVEEGLLHDLSKINELPERTKMFNRTCDVVFTTLTPRVLVDVPRTNRDFATSVTRMYRKPGHIEERGRMLNLARQVRDAAR